VLKRLSGWRPRIHIGDKNAQASWLAVILGSVAFLMDFLALWRGNHLPKTFWSPG